MNTSQRIIYIFNVIVFKNILTFILIDHFKELLGVTKNQNSPKGFGVRQGFESQFRHLTARKPYRSDSTKLQLPLL